MFALIKNYSIGHLKGDLFGGISVAILSIPIAVAFAEIAGMRPEAGIYTAVLALVAYFVLGSSDKVIMGTDFATVILFAATVTAAFGTGHPAAPQFMMFVTVMTGIWMFVAGLLKLGFVANFLSRPIMLGYLNGVSIMLIVSQLDKLTGITLVEQSLLRRIAEVVEKAGLVHLPTLFLGIVSIVFVLLFTKISTRLPGAIILFAISVVAAGLFNFAGLGIAFMPKIQDPYPSIILPDIRLFVDHFSEIFFASAAVMFVSYTSAIPVVRGFSPDRGGFDADREFYALGFAHVLIGFFGGYPISADDSRTAVNVAVGGKTKVVSIIAAIIIVLTIFLVPGILTALPLVTSSAIIAAAGIVMFERGAGIALYRKDKREFLVFAVCVAGVLAFGVYQGILFAIVIAFLQLIKRSSKPMESEWIYDEETASLRERTDDSILPDDRILIYRFGAALLFYNVDYFAEKITARVKSRKDLKLVVIDAAPINIIDFTALPVIKDLVKTLNDEGITVTFAGANASFRSSVAGELESSSLNTDVFFPNVHAVLARHLSKAV